jgi:hypothetical protein
MTVTDPFAPIHSKDSFRANWEPARFVEYWSNRLDGLLELWLIPLE